jgi:hypothetical protein
VRAGGLHGNTFEIEVVAAPVERAPVFTRGYVTCAGLHRGAADLEGGVRRVPGAVPAALRDGAAAVAFVELATHRGHFLGRAISRLLIFEHDGGAFIRDIGCWDPLPRHLAKMYETAGKEAQAAFWGREPRDMSMLAQLAQVSAGG